MPTGAASATGRAGPSSMNRVRTQANIASCSVAACSRVSAHLTSSSGNLEPASSFFLFRGDVRELVGSLGFVCMWCLFPNGAEYTFPGQPASPNLNLNHFNITLLRAQWICCRRA